MIRKIGSLKLGNSVYVSDPLCPDGGYRKIQTACKPGTYTGYVSLVNPEEYGGEIEAVGIYLKEKVETDGIYLEEKVASDKMRYAGSINTETGFAGFFNGFPELPLEEESECLSVPDHYCGEYEPGARWFESTYGLFAETPEREGEYRVFATPARDAFTIIFIQQ